MGTRPQEDVVEDHEDLWRSILEDQVDTKEGRPRPQSGCFRSLETDGVSVRRARLAPLEYSQSSITHPYIAVVTAAEVRSQTDGKSDVVPDPLPDDPSHALIRPSPGAKAARRIARLVRWLRTRVRPKRSEQPFLLDRPW